MYRQYESPSSIKKRIETVKAKMKKEKDKERLYDLHEELEELKERLNFAYQDQEEEY